MLIDRSALRFVNGCVLHGKLGALIVRLCAILSLIKSLTTINMLHHIHINSYSWICFISSNNMFSIISGDECCSGRWFSTWRQLSTNSTSVVAFINIIITIINIINMMMVMALSQLRTSCVCKLDCMKLLSYTTRNKSDNKRYYCFFIMFHLACRTTKKQ